jgi:hypothetical protein
MDARTTCRIFFFFVVGLVATAPLVGLVSILVLLAAPVALTYAALSRRLIDVGFFLNRATVFTIVSAIVIGGFVLAEWAASAWLTSTTHTTSVFIGMAVALGLGISLRYIHRYVERFVDRVFFRKRHEDESALRRFAHEAAYISDRSTLLDRTVQAVKEHTTAKDAEILVRDGAATYAFVGDGQRPEVSENDPGIIALRAVARRVCVSRDLTRRPSRRAHLWCQARRRGVCPRRVRRLAGSRSRRGDGVGHPFEPKQWRSGVDTRNASPDAARA